MVLELQNHLFYLPIHNKLDKRIRILHKFQLIKLIIIRVRGCWTGFNKVCHLKLQQESVSLRKHWLRESFKTSKSFNYLDDIKLILKLILGPWKFIVFFEISIGFQLFDISQTKTIPKIVLNHFTTILESVSMKQNRK